MLRDDAPTVVVVDDHPLWRQTLSSVIERGAAGRVIAEAADGETALRLVERLRPDLVVMDMHLPGMSGAAATAAVVEHHPTTRVLVLSSSDERSSVIDAVRAGAAGYLLKTAEAEEIYDAIRRVLRGELVFPPALASFVLEELRSAGLDGVGGAPARHRTAGSALDGLTEREREVLQLMAEGRSNQAIADRLFVSGKSVESNVARIFSKLGLEVAPDDHRRVLAVVAYLGAAERKR